MLQQTDITDLKEFSKNFTLGECKPLSDIALDQYFRLLDSYVVYKPVFDFAQGKTVEVINQKEYKGLKFVLPGFLHVQVVNYKQ
jgi:hypothetical protein